MSNQFVVPLTNENVEKRFREIGVPTPGAPFIPSPATLHRIHEFLCGKILVVHHASNGAWLRNSDNAMSYFIPGWTK